MIGELLGRRKGYGIDFIFDTAALVAWTPSTRGAHLYLSYPHMAE